MIEQLLRQGRGASWLPFGLAALMLLAVIGYGIAIYDSIPDQIPQHYGPGGDATRWEAKSPGTVFFPILMSFAGLFVLPIVALVLPAMMSTPDDASDWTRLRIEGSVRGTRAGLGWVALLTVGITAWISVVIWQASDHAPGWPIAALLAGIFVALWLAYRRWSRWARRTAELHGIRPTPEEEAEDRLWLPLGLYNNPEDPRVLVPKREGYGVGTTVNLGSRGGKILVAAFLAVLIVPILLVGVLF